MTFRLLILIAAVASLCCPRDASAGSIINGGFELQSDGTTPSVVGQVNVSTTLQGWSVGSPENSSQAHGFAFVVDSNADANGFPTENSPPNLYLWGPNTPNSQGGGVANGFTGSPDSGNFLGVSGGYATALVSQTVTGLTPGDTYTLSFDWAASQLTTQTGATMQWWQVGFGSNSTQDTTQTSIPSEGFSGWMNATMTFTADGPSDVLSFQAEGTPSTLNPFLLLDGVSLTDNSLPPPPPPPPAPAAVPEPTTLIPSLIGGVFFLVAARRRRRASRNASA